MSEVRLLKKLLLFVTVEVSTAIRDDVLSSLNAFLKVEFESIVTLDPET